ncbi:hypothetical protein C369_04456 [Cryptococcus neoformans A5-35-17]|nr:hypothetical protein C369_04456 [Cryptococcus neoformans var. grubii A5-35-17]
MPLIELISLRLGSSAFHILDVPSHHASLPKSQFLSSPKFYVLSNLVGEMIKLPSCKTSWKSKMRLADLVTAYEKFVGFKRQRILKK